MAAAKLLESFGHTVEESFLEALLDPDLGPRELPPWRIGAQQTT